MDAIADDGAVVGCDASAADGAGAGNDASMDGSPVAGVAEAAEAAGAAAGCTLCADERLNPRATRTPTTTITTAAMSIVSRRRDRSDGCRDEVSMTSMRQGRAT
jgi:hypothetical protein